MNKIIIHWTAGSNYPNETDKAHYHFLIDKTGRVINGRFKPEDNEVCKPGKYAPHTGGGNTGAVGIGLCGMCGFVNRDNIGHYPLTKIQVERCFKLIAELSKKYSIPIDAKHVMTHYEFGCKHLNTTSKGKIDIVFLSTNPDLSPDKIGNHFRQKAKWYLSKI